MDVKIKTENDFETYYNEKYAEIVGTYYKEISKKRILTIIGHLVLGVVIIAVAIYFMNNNKEKIPFYTGDCTNLFLWFAVFIAFITILSIYRILKKYMYDINEVVIKDIFGFIADKPQEEIKYEPKSKLSDDSLAKAELFNLELVKNRGKNFISLSYNKNSMTFVDMHIYNEEVVESKKYIYKNGKRYIRTTRKRKKNTIFDGVYFGAAMNKKNTSQLYLIPNNLNDTVLQSKIMSYIKFHGVPVMLEDLEFTKKYKVFCDDEIQARYILSLNFMEKINQLDEVIKGKKYIVFKEGKRFAMCIEGASIEKTRNRTLPCFRNKKREYKTLSKMFTELNVFIRIYHVLDLGNTLYTAHL